MSHFLPTLIQDIDAGDILALLDELEHAVPVVSREAMRAPLIAFLTQCVYPKGLGKRKPIKLDLALQTPILETRVGKLPDGDLRDLCAELAGLTGTALEFYQGIKVYALLNKALPKFPEPKKPSALQARKEALVRQRRANR